MRLLDKVEKLLRQKKIPQEELARAMFVPPNRISKWKAGQGVPRPQHLLHMSRFFGVSIESLVDDAIPEPKPHMTLTKEEQSILHAVEALGFAEAMKRLVHSPVAPASEAGVAVSWEEPPRKVRKRGKRRASG